MENYKFFKIHIFYIIGFLLFVIIGLITIQWSEITDLVNYITFALTLSSLVLSILAIVYSFISNSRFSETMGALNNVSKDVLDSTIKLNTVTDDLTRQVEEIPIHLKNVEDQTEKTHQLIESIQLIKETSVEPATTKKEELSSVESFLTSSSFYGKKLLFACSLSFSTKKNFVLTDLFESSQDYMWGYFIASTAMKLFKYTETNKVILVTDINVEITEKIRDIAFKSAENYDKDKTPEELIKFSWMRDLEIIETYFNKKN